MCEKESREQAEQQHPPHNTGERPSTGGHCAIGHATWPGFSQGEAARDTKGAKAEAQGVNDSLAGGEWEREMAAGKGKRSRELPGEGKREWWAEEYREK